MNGPATRSVTVHLTPAEAVALYEASRNLDWNMVAGGDDRARVFWRSEDWMSARVQLERTLRGENDFTDALSTGVQGAARS